MMENIEGKLIELIAIDRIHIPISSMSGKLKRREPKIAQEVASSMAKSSYSGSRAYARLEEEDKMKARGTAEGIKIFSKMHPKYGTILSELIEEKRAEHETHLYFGMQEGSRITSDDYLGVMSSLGISEGVARELYPELMEVSRKLSKKRDEERSVMTG